MRLVYALGIAGSSAGVARERPGLSARGSRQQTELALWRDQPMTHELRIDVWERDKRDFFKIKMQNLKSLRLR
jgi:hypothetical protein